MLSKVSRFLHVQPRHWSERIPRVFWAKSFENPRRTNGDIGWPTKDAPHCDRALGESVFDLEHDGATMTQRKDCTHENKCLHATATFAFEQFLHLIFSLDWDRIHSSEEEKQQNPKSWVQFFGTLFLAVSGTLLFASCQNGATKHHPAGFSMLGLVVWRRAWLATWSKGRDIRVLPPCLFFGMVSGWQVFLILWEEAL